MLETQKIPVSMRLRRGIDINAGCGQLASHNKRS
jgi:adenine C2-methylase RlmN of 23S rRNA A2503 and tRNA A37